MALESVDYSEDKACKILEIVMQDDKNTKVESKQEIVEDACVDNETAVDASRPLPLSKSDARYLICVSFFFFSFSFSFGYFVTLAHQIIQYTFGCVNEGHVAFIAGSQHADLRCS